MVFDKTGLEKYILPFIIVSFILAFLSPSIVSNLNYIKDFWLISALILAYYIFNSKDKIIKVIYFVISISLLHSILSLIQYILNINFVNLFKYGIAHYKAFGINAETRGSFLGMHLVFSCYMVLLSIPLIYISFYHGKKFSKKIKLFIKLSAILSLAVLFINQTKSIILALPFSLLPILHYKKHIAFLLLPLIVVIIVFSLSYSRNDNFIHDKIEHSLFDSRSFSERVKIWELAFHVWRMHPIIGTGGGSYLAESKKIVAQLPKQDKPLIISHAHNDYLNQLARKGIIGFTAFIYMLFGIFRFFWKNLNKINDIVLKLYFWGLFASYCIFLIASLFQCFYTDEENLVMFWFNIGLAAAIVKIDANETIQNTGSV
ncbi:MAG: O-antigen ligase family protein [Spirochaetes bacterium]|nr:O-antigen ligase family protein [Spirochaetota bacterium]